MDAEFQGAILNQSGQQLYKLVSRQFLLCPKKTVLNQKLLPFSPLALEHGTSAQLGVPDWSSGQKNWLPSDK